MSSFLIPNDDSFVETVAKSIARSRMHGDTEESLAGQPEIYKEYEPIIDQMFEELWEGDTEFDEVQRASYRKDAIAAINAINLKLITTID